MREGKTFKESFSPLALSLFQTSLGGIYAIGIRQLRKCEAKL